MARRKKRSFSTFNLSFLDIMSCGFGAVVLVFLIIDHSIEVESRELNVDLLSEVNLLEEDVREGQKNLVVLRNALDDTDLELVEAQGRATRVSDEIEELEGLIAALIPEDVSESEAAEKLAAAAEVLSGQDQAIQLRYLQTLVEIAGDKSSTIVFPIPVDLLEKLDRHE